MELSKLQLVYVKFIQLSKKNVLKVDFSNAELEALEVLDVQNGTVELAGEDIARERAARKRYCGMLRAEYCGSQ